MPVTGVELELPAPARLDRLELLPAQVFGVSVVDPADVDEHDGIEAQPLEDAVAAGPRVSPGVVEGEQKGPRRQVDRLSPHEPQKGRQVDRLVAGVLDHRHLLGEVVEVDPVGRVHLVREVALGADSVVEEDRHGRAVRRERRPHLFLLGGEHHLGSGLRRPRCALVAGAATRGHEQSDAAGEGNERHR